MRWAAGLAAAALASLALYLAAWPVPVEPRAWVAPVSGGYTDAHAPNTRLAGLQHIDLGGEEGPEHVALGPDGKLYAAVASGAILRMDPDGSGREVFARTQGRVLGFDFDAGGNLIAADAFLGLLAISPQGQASVLTNAIAGDPIRYADAVAVAADGRMYFSDASTRFAPPEWGGTFAASFLDILEQQSTGRILVYDPAQKTTELLARGLSFANGVALSADGRSLFVNETGKYRVWKLATGARNLDLLAGPPPSPEKASVLLDNLPGFPDNLMRGRDGRLWLGFAKPRSAAIDKLATYPRVRALLLRLPKFLWPVPPAYGHVIAFDETGRILADLQDPSGAYPETTAITETVERLYVQSLHAHTLGWLPTSSVLR